MTTHTQTHDGCSVDGCDRPARVKGKAGVSKSPLCQRHYFLFRNGQPLRKLRVRYKPGQTCSVSMCLRKAFADTICRAHYARRLRGQEDWKSKPVKHRQTNGGVLVKNFRLSPTLNEFLNKYSELRGLPLHETINEILRHWHAQRLTGMAGGTMNHTVAWARQVDDNFYEGGD
jgi:hypothetical protein